MATNKMLIDASHPEETRVAVVRGNRIEEFDFESLEKQQLRGNIYLAKVTRVEPSLQAAFVDYGGNRHGFLAFSEIHPDYYQIPIADRQALLEAEAAEARASREADDLEDEKPKKKRTRRSKTAQKPDSEDETSPDNRAEDEALSDENSKVDAEDSDPVEKADSNKIETAEEPKKKTRRPRKRVKKASDSPATDEPKKPVDDEVSAADSPAETPANTTETDEVAAVTQAEDLEQSARDDDVPPAEGEDQGAAISESDTDAPDTPPKSMAAMVEMDTISEPASDPDSGSEDENDENENTEIEEKPAPKKRRRSTRAKAKPAKSETDGQSAVDEDKVGSAETPVTDETQEDTTEPDTQAELVEASNGGSEDESDEPKAEKPKRKRSTRRKRTAAPEESENETVSTSEEGNGAEDEDEDVESVGQEDALEEVPERFKTRRQYKIQEVIKRRQVLLVQVVKEERGNKGAALTTYLSLAGRYSVLMPNTARGGGISRKITNANDRKRLKAVANELEVPEGMGVILRTAGASRTKAEINRDFEYLLRLWEKVRNLTLSSSAPCLVYEEGSLIKRSIRDLYNKDIGEILVSGEAGYQEASDFMGMLMPKHVKNVKQYDDPATIFTRFGVEAQLERMVAPQVTLKSGGYLVMNQTEALVAIDVNSGRSTREHSIEDTALQTNLEAAEEVARQLRLRDLAGLIVIDFIDMEEKRNNRAVEKRLKDCLKNDRARIQVGRISHFGLLEMSRQRIRASVLESTMDACPHCQGMGYVRSESAIALHVFRAIEEHLGKHNRFNIIIKTSPSIALYILNHKRMALLDLESRFGLKIVIEGDMNIVGQEFKIERGEPARGRPANKNSMAYNGGSDDGEAVSSDDQDNGDEEGGDRKRRRKRRRGKRREQDDDNIAEANPTDEIDTETDEKSSDGDDEADAGSSAAENRPKSRRGKRGGRRKNATASDPQKDSSSDVEMQNPTDETATADNVGDENADDAGQSEEIQASQSPSRRLRRSTKRPKKEGVKPVEAIVNSAPDSSEASGSVETAPSTTGTEEQESTESATSEPPRKARRSTRRPKKTEMSADGAQADEVSGEGPALDQIEAHEIDPDHAPDTEVIASAEDSGDAEPPKKRGGWWSRGGGFFG